MDCLLVLQAFTYLLLVVLGLITTISSGLVRDYFGGTCLIYAVANCTDDASIVHVTPGISSVCTFVPASNLLVSVFYAFLLFCYHVYFAHRSKLVAKVAYQMCLKMLCFGAVLATALTIVSAASLSVGLSVWCNSVQSTINMHHSNFTISACNDVQHPSITWITTGAMGADVKVINTDDYYNKYYMAQTSSWFSAVLWLFLTISYIYRLVKNSKERTVYNDPFFTDLVEDAFT